MHAALALAALLLSLCIGLAAAENVTYVTAEQFAALQAQMSAAGDTAWLLISSALVFLMTPGLAFFYGGLVHRRNVINTIQMSIATISAITIIWYVCGYSFAFGPGDGFLGDGTYAFLMNVTTEANSAYVTTVPQLVFMIYQLMFAIITPALISGAVVERMSFRAYMIFVSLWSILVYDVVAHWSWSAWLLSDGTLKLGWLREFGVLDFAGGNVVHVIAGVGGLVAAYFVGPRHGYPAETAPAHNLPMVVLGTGLLWFGWFGFNAGSALQANGLAATAFCNTHIATSAAFLTWLIMESIVSRPSTAGACTGAVVGLVAITPAAGFVPVWSSVFFGIFASIVTFTTIYLKHKFVGADSKMGRLVTSIDDSLDAFSCHFMGGMTGSVLLGLFASTSVNPAGRDGAFFGNPRQLGIQIAASLVCALWSGVISAFIMIILKYTVGIRVPLAVESDGLDAGEHGEIAYHLVNRELLLENFHKHLVAENAAPENSKGAVPNTVELHANAST